jgi:glycosyltransferase involved in cell wall biosynthesis
MLNILVNAYAVSPNWGSEQGMGWNWIINIAKYCNVYAITEGEWQDEILEAVEKLPQKDNIHFYFNPLPDNVRKMCWNQGDWRFYWYYRKWQKKTYDIAKEIIENYKIDVIHQLNMVGFREPGYLWKFKNIPIVWGPVSGMHTVPRSYRSGSNLKAEILLNIKYFISDIQIRCHPRVRRMVRESYMFAAVKSVVDKVEYYYGKKIPMINETGIYIDEEPLRQRKEQSEDFKLLWVGRLLPTKRLDIALKTIAEIKNPRVKLTICGTGCDSEVRTYKKQIRDLGIEQQVIWLGKVPHERIEQIMRNSDLFFFTSVAEATSTVVVEAISVGLPVLSFNTCGFGPLVKSFAGETIELTTPQQSICEFADRIRFLIKNPQRLMEISKKTIKNRELLTWDYKAKRMLGIYREVIEKTSRL